MERIEVPELPNLALEIDWENQRSFGPCSCCGEMTSRVWGFAYRGAEALAAYFVEWTPGHEHREATIDLIIGLWGEQAAANDRRAVSVAFRHLQTGPAFMIQNASVRPVCSSELVSGALDREDVLGTALANDAFAVCDLVYLGDPRIGELRASEVSE
ncbi:MAG TPA: hypothetical protein VM865_06920 [Acidobacteriaceae bacterium]|jgi:hypothetical protein|nr:hypothetical protein [Acidobacteriaceae bacterium]